MRYLKQEEKEWCRPLWKEAFPEDSAAFTDYYFREKMKDNQVLIKEEDGQVIAMLHRNPYCVQAGSKQWDVDYIVGVATRADRRHRGHMRDLLHRMFRDMYEEEQPFTFLMPEAEAIYLPFGFTYIYDQPGWVLKDPAQVQFVKCEDTPEQIEKAGDVMERWLADHYQVFCHRDPAYVERLIKELKSENGNMEFLYDQDALIGVYCQWGQRQVEQRMLICPESYRREEKPAKPAIMARIIHLERFVQAIHLKADSENEQMSVLIRVEDPVLSENHGTFLWHLDRQSSRLERVETEKPCPCWTISELTAWLFGYQSWEGAAWSQEIQLLAPVFLDEAV